MQTRRESLIEAAVQTTIGYVVSLVVQVIAYPAFGHAFTFTQNLGLGVVFAVVSLIRGYVIRRWFNTYIKRFITWFTQ